MLVSLHGADIVLCYMDFVHLCTSVEHKYQDVGKTTHFLSRYIKPTFIHNNTNGFIFPTMDNRLYVYFHPIDFRIDTDEIAEPMDGSKSQKTINRKTVSRILYHITFYIFNPDSISVILVKMIS